MPDTPSANNTLVTLNGGAIIDASDNLWTLSNGQIQVNGVVDPTTANVIKLAYVNGQVWQENADNLWWAKSSPCDAWSPAYGTPVSPVPASANDTAAGAPFLTGSATDSILFNNDGHVQTIFDANGNVWSVDAAGQVVVNGMVDPTTANVLAIYYIDGQIWQNNISNLWWAKSNPGDAWSPPYGAPDRPRSAGTPLVSANNRVGGGSGLSGVLITDANGNVWSINASGQVLVNGVTDLTTANVVALAYENGQVWQENTSGLWWAKSSPNDAWSPAYGTPVSPLPPVRTWLGGADKAASNFNNWSPTGTPQPGDTLEVSGTATINVSGNDLAGDNLNIYGSPTNPTTVTINATDNAQLNIEENNSNTTINVADTATVNLLPTNNGQPNIGELNFNTTINVADTATVNLLTHQANLHTSGGTLQFITLFSNASYLSGNNQLNSNLTGNATVSVAGGTTELSGAAGQGLTFNLVGNVNVQIDHPDQFAGNIALFPDSVITFAGLTATNGELLKGILSLFNGDQEVGSFPVDPYFQISRYGPASTLTLDQTDTGVVLVLSANPNFLGSATATLLPLTYRS